MVKRKCRSRASSEVGMMARTGSSGMLLFVAHSCGTDTSVQSTSRETLPNELYDKLTGERNRHYRSREIEGDRLVDVLWEGNTIMMFAQDLRARGERTEGAP